MIFQAATSTVTRGEPRKCPDDQVELGELETRPELDRAPRTIVMNWRTELQLSQRLSLSLVFLEVLCFRVFFQLVLSKCFPFFQYIPNSETSDETRGALRREAVTLVAECLKTHRPRAYHAPAVAKNSNCLQEAIAKIRTLMKLPSLLAMSFSAA